jgi:hypothetical protein
MKRRRLTVLATAAAAGALLITAANASAATPKFTLTASIAGGITQVSTGDPITFVFTETNNSHRATPEDIVVKYAHNVHVNLYSCGGGSADGRWCEPGFVSPGHSVSMDVYATATGDAGTVAAARACLINENTGVWGQCRTAKAEISAAS